MLLLKNIGTLHEKYLSQKYLKDSFFSTCMDIRGLLRKKAVLEHVEAVLIPHSHVGRKLQPERLSHTLQPYCTFLEEEVRASYPEFSVDERALGKEGVLFALYGRFGSLSQYKITAIEDRQKKHRLSNIPNSYYGHFYFSNPLLGPSRFGVLLDSLLRGKYAFLLGYDTEMGDMSIYHYQGKDLLSCGRQLLRGMGVSLDKVAQLRIDSDGFIWHSLPLKQQ